jgi:hypothetical protein
MVSFRQTALTANCRKSFVYYFVYIMINVIYC